MGLVDEWENQIEMIELLYWIVWKKEFHSDLHEGMMSMGVEMEIEKLWEDFGV